MHLRLPSRLLNLDMDLLRARSLWLGTLACDLLRHEYWARIKRLAKHGTVQVRLRVSTAIIAEQCGCSRIPASNAVRTGCTAIPPLRFLDALVRRQLDMSDHILSYNESLDLVVFGSLAIVLEDLRCSRFPACKAT